MKIKGIGKAEQSVEKIILGIVALVFLAILTMQFTIQPNQVTVAGQQLPPERAFEPVATAADRLLGRVRDSRVELPEPQNLTTIESFTDGLKAPVAPRPVLVAALGPNTPIGPENLGPGPSGDAKYAQVDVPAPTDVITHAFASTLHPAVVMQTEGLANLVSAEQPFDKSAVSIEATYDGLALREALEYDPEGQLRPFPLNWRSDVAIIGVEIERERLVSGEWTELNPIEQPPGAANMLDVVTTGEINGMELAAAVEQAHAQSKSIQRPGYYPTIAGPQWAPPRMFQVAVDTEPTDEERKIAAHIRNIDQLDVRIEKLEEQIADAGAQPGRPPAPNRGRGRGGRGGGGGGGAPPTTKPQDDPKDKLQKRLDGYKQDRDDQAAKLAELGYDPNAADDEMDQAWRDEPAAQLLDDDAVPIWAHDLRVVPGETYRYRMRVVINNPAFGRADFLDEDQKHMAQNPLIRGRWSRWSEPVDVLDNQYFFVSSATEGGQISATPRATIEVYRFYYGYWRKATENIEPGDTVATELKFVNPDLFPIYDLDAIQLALVDPDDNPFNPPPGIRPPDPRNPGRGRQPAGVAPPDPRRAPRVDPPKDEPKLPDNAVPGPERLPVVLDVVLLDVTAWPSVAPASAGDSPTQVILRDRHGKIITRRPDLDDLSPLYKLVAHSARQARERDKPAGD